MRLLLDEDSQCRSRVRLLREAGHDVLTVAEAGLHSHRDKDVLARAVAERRTLVTRNIRDFLLLHEAYPNHAGILGEHQDQDPSKNMSDAVLARAIYNLEASGWDIAGQFVALNAWSFGAEE